MAVHHTPGHVRLRLGLAAGWIQISTGESDETRVEIIPLNEDPHRVKPRPPSTRNQPGEAMRMR